jgi:hypothetical protein
MIMSDIEAKLEKMEAMTGQARIARDSAEMRQIFKQMPESEFINILDNVSSGRPNIQYTPTEWIFKKAFPVNDRK